MFENVLDSHGLEGAVADMKRYLDHADLAFVNRLQDGRREVQSGGRRGDRAARLCEHGLVAIAIVVAVVAIALVGLLLSSTTLGRTMRAVADDRALAAVAGIDTGRVVLATWVLSGLLAALAGVLAGLVQSTFDPNFGFTLLLPVFAAVVLGGIGNPYGALAGGFLLGIVTELSTWDSLGGGVDPVYKPVVAFAVLIVVLLARPQGLLGRARLV